MNNTKNLYLITLMFLGFMLYTQWQKDYTTIPTTEDTGEPVTNTQAVNAVVEDDYTTNNTLNNPVVDDDIPQPLNNDSSNNDLPAVSESSTSTQIIATVDTPLLKLEFSAKGAALVYAELKAYPIKKKNEANHVILMDYRDNNFKIDS